MTACRVGEGGGVEASSSLCFSSTPSNTSTTGRADDVSCLLYTPHKCRQHINHTITQKPIYTVSVT